MFRGKFLALLATAFRRKKLRLLGELQPLQRPGTFDRFVRSLRKPKWVVEVRAPLGGPEHVLRYLARYTHRVAISNGRLLELRGGQVTFRWRNSADHNTQKVMTIDAVEFIRRFLLHVLPTGLVKIRHFGFLANGCRADALKLCRTLLRVSQQPDPLSIPQRNAIERKCPCCGIGTLCLLGYVPAQLLNSSMMAVAPRSTRHETPHNPDESIATSIPLSGVPLDVCLQLEKTISPTHFPSPILASSRLVGSQLLVLARHHSQLRGNKKSSIPVNYALAPFKHPPDHLRSTLMV